MLTNQRNIEELVVLKYAIVGAGGIRIPFKPVSSDRIVSENLAIARAKNLNCFLYAKSNREEIWEIYPEKKLIPKRAKINAAVYPEMLTDAQMTSDYSSLNFV